MFSFIARVPSRFEAADSSESESLLSRAVSLHLQSGEVAEIRGPSSY
jgi:hypothetical protein